MCEAERSNLNFFLWRSSNDREKKFSFFIFVVFAASWVAPARVLFLFYLCSLLSMLFLSQRP